MGLFSMYLIISQPHADEYLKHSNYKHLWCLSLCVLFPMNVWQSLLQMYPIVQAGQKFMHTWHALCVSLKSML